MKNNDKSECQCDDCQRACTFKPGWFNPGEAEKVAEFLGISLIELFQQYLGVDYWVQSRKANIYLLAPAVTTMKPGTVYPSNPRGQCVFYTEGGLCAIHPVKPYECARLHHNDTGDLLAARHEGVARRWESEDGRDQIKALLGAKPVQPEEGDKDGPYYGLPVFLEQVGIIGDAAKRVLDLLDRRHEEPKTEESQ